MWQLDSKCTYKEETYNLENVECKLVKLCINFKEKDPLEQYVMPLLHQ